MNRGAPNPTANPQGCAYLDRASALRLALRLTLGGLFVLASLGKIADAFALALARYRLVPLSFIWPLAYVLPWCELVAGLSVALGLFARSGAAVLALLSALLALATVSAIARQPLIKTLIVR